MIKQQYYNLGAIRLNWQNYEVDNTQSWQGCGRAGTL